MNKACALILLVALAACASQPMQPQVNNMRSNANETLTVALSAANVSQAIRALQSDPSVNASSIGVDITPQIAPRQISNVQDQAYIAALADARAKADTLAGQLGLHGGVVRSVNEMEGAGAEYVSAATHSIGVRATSIRMSAPANGIVTLAVTYDFGGTPISVFGMQVGTPAETAMADATGINVRIQARGQSLGDAAKKLRAVEAAVRAISHRFGARDADIIVQSTGANSY